jgi:hypothetical protein
VPESTVSARLGAAKRKLRDDLGAAVPDLGIEPVSEASR